MSLSPRYTLSDQLSYGYLLKIIHTIFQEAVVKSCENDFSNTILVAKVKVEFHINV